MKKYLLLLFLIIPCLAKADFNLETGEKCEYSVSVMGFDSGKLILQINQSNNSDILELTSKIETSGFISRFYSLKQNSSSLWSKSLKTFTNHQVFIEENKKSKTIKEVNDFSLKKYVYIKESKDESKKVLIDSSNKNYQDTTSIIFFLRDISFEKDKKVSIVNLGEIKDVYLEKLGEEKVNGTNSEKIKVKIDNETENLFWVELGGKNRILKMKFKSKSGTINSALIKCNYLQEVKNASN